MSLLKLVRVETKTDVDTHWFWLSAWLEYIDDNELRSALLATNVNIVRRSFPYVYMFCNGYDASSLYSEVLDGDYERTMKTLQLSRGIWIGQPSFYAATTTFVVQIGIGDILPFVHLLDQDEFGLLCLRTNLTLEYIDDVIYKHENNDQAIRTLLRDGGCTVSIIDTVNFKVTSLSDFLNDLRV